MSVFNTTLGLALATSVLGLLGGYVATEHTKYSAVSNEAAAIYSYEVAMLDAAGEYSADLSQAFLSQTNDRFIVTTPDAYAVVIQTATGDIYVSTSTSPNPIRVSASDAEVIAVPSGVDGAAITSAIASYAAEQESTRTDFERTTGDILAAIGTWLVEDAPKPPTYTRAG